MQELIEDSGTYIAKYKLSDGTTGFLEVPEEGGDDDYYAVTGGYYLPNNLYAFVSVLGTSEDDFYVRRVYDLATETQVKRHQESVADFPSRMDYESYRLFVFDDMVVEVIDYVMRAYSLAGTHLWTSDASEYSGYRGSLKTSSGFTRRYDSLYILGMVDDAYTVGTVSLEDGIIAWGYTITSEALEEGGEFSPQVLASTKDYVAVLLTDYTQGLVRVICLNPQTLDKVKEFTDGGEIDA